MGRIIPYIMENKKCSKPPTRMGLFVIYHHLSFIMANLRYPAKKGTNLSWLVDNPIDSTKTKG
jgi:hypothetical protein